MSKEDRRFGPRSLLGGDYGEPIQAKTSTLAMWPHRPKRITDALYELAESQPSPEEYERRKQMILSDK